jgi:kynurenine formamidase
MKIVDLSVPFYEGMPTDDLGPKFWVRLSHAAARQLYQHTQSREGRVFLTTDHTGTHLDGPLRFDPTGVSVEKIPLERVILPANLLDLRRPKTRAFPIGPAELEKAGAGLHPGEAAVLWTGHDLHLKSPDYFWNRPQLTLEGADWLVRRRVGLVAADFPGIGEPSDDRYMVKRALHRGGILTTEQLCNLAPLEGQHWHLCVPPIRIRGCAGSLVRAVGLVEWQPKELVDLSQDIYQGMTALGGAVPTTWTRANHTLTAFFYKGECSYQTTSLFLSEHAGTHLDAPYHFDEHAHSIDEIPLSRLYARARVLDLSHKKPLEGIAPADLEQAAARQKVTIEPGDAAVIWTEHSKNYERPDFTSNRPFITAEGAAWLRDRRPGYLVTDLVGLDPMEDETTPVHLCFLMAGIPFMQVTRNLSRLATGQWHIAAFPLKLVRGSGSPLRPFAVRT